MSTEITTEARKSIAAEHGLNEQYLYQCLRGLREMSPVKARELEESTGGQLRRWSLCQKTWHLIWPELMDEAGAPESPNSKGQIGGEA